MSKLKIADLSERISVRYFETERDEYGNILRREELERCRIWAQVYALSAKKFDAQPERANKITYRVTIRYREDIKPDDEILWRGRRLKMLSPPFSLDGQKIFTAMDCEEAIEDGRQT